MYRMPTGDVVVNSDVFFTIANKIEGETPQKVKLYIMHSNYDLEIIDMKFKNGYYTIRKHFPEGHYRYVFEFVLKDRTLFFGADEELSKSIPIAFHLHVYNQPTIKERIQSWFYREVANEY